MAATPVAPPTNVKFGTVRGRFIVGINDGPDAGSEPDFIPASGEITFTPSVPYVPNPGAPGGPVTMIKTEITAVLDSEGYLCTRNPDGTAGSRDVLLVATDDPGMLVQDWTWNVGYALRPAGNVPLILQSHGISVPAGEVTDLTTTIKVPSTPGYGVPQAEAAALRAEKLVETMTADSITASVQAAEAALAAALEGLTGGDSIKVGGAGPSDGWWFDNGSAESVTAPAPTFSDQDGTAADTYTIPAATGVQYRVGGVERSAGTYPGSGSVTVTAHALPGYVLMGTASWSFTFSTSAAPVAVTPTAPTASDTADTYTIPSMTGVEYLVGGVVKAAGTYSVGDVDATVTVTARAQAGYTLTGQSSWTLTFTKTPPAPIPSGEYNPAVMADGPALYLPLDDPAGTTSPRVLGAYAAFNTFSLVGGAAFGGAGVGDGATALSKPTATSGFTSNEPEVMRSASSALLSGVTTWSMEFLMAGMSTAAPSAGSGPIAGFNQAKIEMNADGTATGPSGLKATSAGAGALSARQHVAYTWDGTTARLYVNGVEVGSSTTARPAFTAKNKLFLESAGGWAVSGGRFAGFAIYEKALTPARVLAHAKAAGLA